LNRPVLLDNFLPSQDEIREHEIATNQIYEEPPKTVPSQINQTDGAVSNSNDATEVKVKVCAVAVDLVKEIQSYQGIAQKIFDAVLRGDFKGRTYDDLGYFVDKFGARLSGTKNLEDAIDFMLEKMKKGGLENVHGEDAMIPHWLR
jgi:hypothetical protein